MKNIKVGDKVRVKNIDFGVGAKNNYKGSLVTVTTIEEDLNKPTIYLIEEDRCYWNWSIDDFEPITKTLDNLEVGDILVVDEDKRMVLAVCGNVYCLSHPCDFDKAVCWYTLHEIKEYGYKLKDSEEPEPKVKKAIKLLEEKGYKVEK